MKEVVLDFYKDRYAIDYPWEQPNTPWVIIPESMCIRKEDANCKLMIDVPSKKVWIKLWDLERANFNYIPFGEFLAHKFDMLEFWHILEFSHEFFYDTIADLKRNLNNKQHMKILFTVDTNQLGAKKIRDDEK